MSSLVTDKYTGLRGRSNERTGWLSDGIVLIYIIKLFFANNRFFSELAPIYSLINAVRSSTARYFSQQSHSIVEASAVLGMKPSCRVTHTHDLYDRISDDDRASRSIIFLHATSPHNCPNAIRDYNAVRCGRKRYQRRSLRTMDIDALTPMLLKSVQYDGYCEKHTKKETYTLYVLDS